MAIIEKLQNWKVSLKTENTRGFRPQTRVELLLTSGFVLLSLLEWVFVSYSGFDAPYGVERGSRVSRRGANFFWSWSLNLPKVGTFFAFLTHFLAFRTHLGFCHRFFLIFLDFSTIWGGFREDFPTIFDTFFETWPNVGKSTKHCVGAWILRSAL